MGDGTTSVVIFAAELLKGAEELVRQKIHPNSVIAGYTLACKEAVKYIRENLTIPTAEIGRDSIVNAAKVTLNYKFKTAMRKPTHLDLDELQNHQHALRLFRQPHCGRR